MTATDFNARNGQSIVLHVSPDTGSQIDPTSSYGEIGRDAGQRSAAGQRIVSVAAVPTRHAAASFGREGSGCETKLAVAVVYAQA
jgi:predicted RNase H-like nuclease